ncbi:expressed unknown protein [Seminavis robusta]|uniref:Uncharacterized protein n=1 Tax=Seminavis robusta TaxID=568900 RepID=A0A9N8EE94_9STRA|nr:expressed unknown protein [Seminavis robusta]|eukprot:Sro867_g213120.1 n/a (222) ;mRNA; f:3766-4431
MCSPVSDILQLVLDPPSRSPSPSPPSRMAAMHMVLPSIHPLSEQKRVTFRSTRTEVHIESLALLPDDKKDELWHKDTDIEAFKARERLLCEEIRLGLSNEQNTRGLELRLCQERQKRKYMIIHAILRAQKRYKDPKQLSNIARKCSVWSKAIAAITAQRDYCELYDPARLASITPIPPVDNYPLPFKAREPVAKIPVKRPISPTIPQRNVRPRPAPLATTC